jgi:hypothetical protein
MRSDVIGCDRMSIGCDWMRLGCDWMRSDVIGRDRMIG